MSLFGLKLKILVVLPEKQFDEKEYEEIIRAAKESKIGITVAGTTTAYAFQGMQGEKIKPHLSLSDAEMEDYHGLVFIGGLGARTLFNDVYCHKLARKAIELERIVAAIDIAPVILAHAEVLRGKKATVHGTEESHLVSCGANYSNEPVVADGLVVTSQHATFAKEFADTVMGALLKAGAAL